VSGAVVSKTVVSGTAVVSGATVVVCTAVVVSTTGVVSVGCLPVSALLSSHPTKSTHNTQIIRKKLMKYRINRSKIDFPYILAPNRIIVNSQQKHNPTRKRVGLLYLGLIKSKLGDLIIC
jgi:hypothetical protein